MIKIKSSFLTGEGILHYVVVAIGAIMVTIPHFTEVATAVAAAFVVATILSVVTV